MKVEKKVLEQVAEYLGNYVYLLIDPRTGNPFYVGKGTRTRVLDHGLEADALTAPTEEPQGEHSRKITAIHGIRQDGLEPEIWILRHGMGSEYTQVEAAAIDLLSSFQLMPSQTPHPLAHLDQLTNARRESSHGHGIETLENIVSEFAAPDLGADTPPLLLVTLKSWVDAEEVTPGGSVRAGYGFKSEWLSTGDRALFAAELGDSVRCWWKLSQSRIERDGIEHVVAVHRGVTRGLFKIRQDAWEQDPITGRRGFQVSPVLEGPVFDRVIGQYGYRTPAKKRGAVTPLTYWPTVTG
ncbi:GIY-YIG nuclease family protein [Arthrobacter sp. OV608]|uniref:GIY-YIG nuclease family protein n=1 Tax=Arthrobacter sp. OV608 TaxID=1882768 RepID=UPI0008D669BF|nr:GIY-YIG nuclease family protein [Arthrobacter sp. OV608]SEQ04498.1 hypothetical protein SAMN05444745_103272 [Arthrobacter sp. OV608]